MQSSSSTIKNGVFTNPQAKSNFNAKTTRSKDKSQTMLGEEEYPLSLRSFSEGRTIELLKPSTHSKRKSSIQYLNKQNISRRESRAFEDDDSKIQDLTRTHPSKIQRSPSKRHNPDMISGSGSDIHPRRLTPSSGETFIESNSEDGDDFNKPLGEINGSQSFVSKQLEINWQKQERRVNRTNSKYKQSQGGNSQSRRRRVEDDLMRRKVRNAKLFEF